MSTFTITSSVRGLTSTADSYDDAQGAACALAKAEAHYLAGTPHWHSVMLVERIHNADGNCTGYRVLRRPRGPLAAHITPTEVVATADIAADFNAVQAEREAEVWRIQVEQVRQWMAEGIEVPANYPVQPSDLPECAVPAVVIVEVRASCPTCGSDGSPCVDCNPLGVIEARADLADEAAARDADAEEHGRPGPIAVEIFVARTAALGLAADAPAPAAPRASSYAAGSRVEVMAGPDAGKLGTVEPGILGSEYVHVRLDQPGAWPVNLYLPEEIRRSTVPPPAERPWANDGAYAALD